MVPTKSGLGHTWFAPDRVCVTSSMIKTVTNAQIKAFAAKARDDADWINKLFQKSSVHSLLEKGDLAFSYHPEVARGRLGKAYKDGTVEWATKGAVGQLVELLDKDTASTIPVFVAGSLGSVWADVTLTGGRGKLRREKLVRLTPSRDGDKLIIMLDNTFDEEW